MHTRIERRIFQQIMKQNNDKGNYTILELTSQPERIQQKNTDDVILKSMKTNLITYS